MCSLVLKQQKPSVLVVASTSRPVLNIAENVGRFAKGSNVASTVNASAPQVLNFATVNVFVLPSTRITVENVVRLVPPASFVPKVPVLRNVLVQRSHATEAALTSVIHPNIAGLVATLVEPIEPVGMVNVLVPGNELFAAIHASTSKPMPSIVASVVKLASRDRFVRKGSASSTAPKTKKFVAKFVSIHRSTNSTAVHVVPFVADAKSALVANVTVPKDLWIVMVFV